MQPTLVVTTETPGLLYLGGRFVGEIGEGREAVCPVPAFGAIYLEHRPLTGAHLPLSARLTLSAGDVVDGSLLPSGKAAAAVWPGSVIEVELMPDAYPTGGETDTVSGDGITASIENGAVRVLGQVHALPVGALPPQVRRSGDEVLLLGALAAGGRYIVVLEGESGRLRFATQGREITPSEGAIRVLVDAQDTVGHAHLETWTAGEGGYVLASSEPMWIHGAPRWPQTPLETALAAVEAAQLGLDDEAIGYFLPGADASGAIAEARMAGGCTALKYALPDGRQAVGLVEAVSSNLARVRPLYYRASVSGGAQGMWRMEWMGVS